ncbi:MAG: hypothetical protein A3F74_11595 [Betaproteobacteria bacterium RIFCSPLOWO2_12_FULL_62_58]|nr:MAG: hypothetical protein A3F74_11595 [Betaproteobacteria bacterium RIFCSPLOWO2_12_FULL_62_58]
MPAEESGPDAAPSHGLLASLRNLAATAVGILQTRLELLATEVEEERLRLLQIALWAVIAVFLLALGILTLTLFVVILFWDTHRVLVTGLLAVLYLVLGAAIGLAARSKARAKSKLFSASLAELAKDREQLTLR